MLKKTLVLTAIFVTNLYGQQPDTNKTNQELELLKIKCVKGNKENAKSEIISNGGSFVAQYPGAKEDGTYYQYTLKVSINSSDESNRYYVTVNSWPVKKVENTWVKLEGVKGPTVASFYVDPITKYNAENDADKKIAYIKFKKRNTMQLELATCYLFTDEEVANKYTPVALSPDEVLYLADAKRLVEQDKSGVLKMVGLERIQYIQARNRDYEKHTKIILELDPDGSYILPNAD